MSDLLTLWEKHIDAVQLFYEETQRSALLADPQVSKDTWVKEANDELKTIKRRLATNGGVSYNGIHLTWWRALSTDEFTDHARLVDRDLTLNDLKPASVDLMEQG